MTQTQTQALTTAPAVAPGRYNEADIRQEMSILRAAFPKLDAPDEGLRALIIASRFSGLNPFRGEIYYVPKIGVTVASKIKAADAVAWAQSHGNTLNIRFEKLNELHPEWQNVQPKAGDVVWVCIIISSKARQDYFNWRIQMIDELKALGYQRGELEAQLNERCGKTAPETRAVGIVRAAEDFGDKFQKATVFTRDDRAQKRALQKALNIGGYAAPDMRAYGGVRIEDERAAADSTIESPYRVVESGVSGAVEYEPESDVARQDYRHHQPANESASESPSPSADLKPVSPRNRALVSNLVELRDTIKDEAKGAAQMDDKQKAAFVERVRRLERDTNAQLVLRGMTVMPEAEKVGDAFKATHKAIAQLVEHDQNAPIADEPIEEVAA